MNGELNQNDLNKQQTEVLNFNNQDLNLNNGVNNQNLNNGINNNQNVEPPKKDVKDIIIIIFMILSIALTVLIVYDRAIKKEDTKEPEKPVGVLMTEDEALRIGNEAYKKLEKYQNNLEELVGDANIENTYEDIYHKYDNFIKDFESIFASNIKLNDVFSENTDEGNGKYSYVNVNNTYYVDAECRASGVHYEFKNLKVEKIEKNKLSFSYKFMPEYIVCTDEEETLNGDVCYKDMDEYNKSLTSSNNLTLELINERNEWKISKVTIQGRCGWTYNVSD